MTGRPAAIGDRVAVGPLGLEGIVQSMHDGAAEVDVRGKRMRARVDELRVLVPAAGVAASPARVRVNVELQPRDTVTTELNVIGSTSDEALTRVERFLDDVTVAELRSAADHPRLRHGAVAAVDRGVPARASVGLELRPAPDNQGGGGVTVVELKE